MINKIDFFKLQAKNLLKDYQTRYLSEDGEIYEFNSTVSKLTESKLSNQIGINGMIITSDGYVLLEKRGRNKRINKNNIQIRKEH